MTIDSSFWKVEKPAANPEDDLVQALESVETALDEALSGTPFS